MKTYLEEIWKPVPHFNGLYEASNLGRVRSFHRSVSGVVMHPTMTPNGVYTLTLCANGGRQSMGVGRVVALAFLGEPEDESLEVQHLSDDLTDDSLSNLRWGRRNECPNTRGHLSPRRAAG